MLIVITAYPDGRASIDTMYYLHQWFGNIFEAGQLIKINKPNVVCARNAAMCAALRSTHEEFLFIDADVEFTPETKSFLSIPGDVVSCQVPMRGKQAWTAPDSFHEACWRTHRKVLESIEPPWFEHRYNDEKTEMIGCICQSFRDKAKANGFTIAHGGWAEHANEGTWCG